MPETEILRRDFPFEIADSAESESESGDSTEPESGGFAGWASVFNRIDLYGTIFAPTAFDDSLENFLIRGFVAGLNHDWSNPIGVPVEARTDPKRGLFVRGELVPTEAGKQSRILLSHRVSTGRSVIRSLSIGCRPIVSTRADSPEAVRRYWESVGYSPDADDLTTLAKTSEITIISNAHLYEVSPVTVPGNPWAAITAARSGQEPESIARRRRDSGLRLRLLIAGLNA